MDYSIGTKRDVQYREYVNSLNFEEFDIRKELDDKCNFFMTITAKRRSGKSVLLKNLCYQIKDWYASCYVFSMSAGLQPDLFDFVAKENIYDGFQEEKLLEIWNAQKAMVMSLKKTKTKDKDIPKVLILFDDIIGSEKVRHSSVLNNFAILGRHLHFAVIILSQEMGGKYGIPKVIRSNVDVAIAFYLDSEVCRDLFCTQYLSAQNKKIGLVIFDKITRGKPYQSIIVLNCKVNSNITEVVKTFIAKEKVPKFKLGELSLEKMKHTSVFTSMPSGEWNKSAMDLKISNKKII